MVFAACEWEGSYQYTFPDGSVMDYDLDENGNPYQLINDKKIYILLPLENLEITAPVLLAEVQKGLPDTPWNIMGFYLIIHQLQLVHCLILPR